MVKRGPLRLQGRAVKIRCAYRNCKSSLDCQNVGVRFTLEPAAVDRAKCRPGLRRHAAVIRFCTQKHLRLASLHQHGKPSRPRGPREGLDASQFVCLFQTLVAKGCPWLAVLVLLQVSMGERGDCACKARRGWLQDLDPTSARPPAVIIPCAVNGKTVARKVPLQPDIANLMHKWLQCEPLRGGSGSTWPWPGQAMTKDTAPLFPGMALKGKPLPSRRSWDTPITRRGCLDRLVSVAVPALDSERAECRKRSAPHPFDGYDLKQLGTHSMKRTSIMALKDVCRSSAVVGSICGTSTSTLDRDYDAPTATRKTQAIQAGLGPIAKLLLQKVDGHGQQTAAVAAVGGKLAESATDRTAESATGVVKFCCSCGAERSSVSWRWCPHCGSQHPVSIFSPS